MLPQTVSSLKTPKTVAIGTGYRWTDLAKASVCHMMVFNPRRYLNGLLKCVPSPTLASIRFLIVILEAHCALPPQNNKDDPAIYD